MMHLKIADHIISVEGDKEQRLLRAYHAFDPFIIEGVDAEWRVRFGCTLPPLSTEAETLYDVEIEDQGIYCRFLSCDSRYSMDIYDRSNGRSLVTLSYIPGSNLVEAS